MVLERCAEFVVDHVADYVRGSLDAGVAAACPTPGPSPTATSCGAGLLGHHRTNLQTERGRPPRGSAKRPRMETARTPVCRPSAALQTTSAVGFGPLCRQRAHIYTMQPTRFVVTGLLLLLLLLGHTTSRCVPLHPQGVAIES